MSTSRRDFLRNSLFTTAGLFAAKRVLAQNDKAEPQEMPSAANGFVPVDTPDVPKLPWRKDGATKVFYLVA